MSVMKQCMAASLGMLIHAMAFAGEPGVALKVDQMRAEPFGDAKVTGALKAGDKVDILRKEGGWFEVKVAKKKGWVRMLSIRKGDAKKGGNEAAGLLSVASGRAGTGKVVASTGIRGLSEEELKAANFNAEELKLAESYAVNRAQAQQFATDGKLVARPIDYLPAVK